MKRDMNLIRELLLDAEAGFKKKSFEGYTEEQVGYHYWLLGDARLMGVIPMTAYGDKLPQAVPSIGGLTWAGHEFLDAARSDTVWAAAMEKANRLGGVTLEVMKELLVALLKSHLGI